MNRILIIGLNGSGKSTFANKLGKKLNREIIYLDKIYHRPGWQPTPRDEWRKIVRNLVSGERWIIDGHYDNTLDIRMPPADTIIFFNFNKFLCLYGVCKRALGYNQPFDQIEGNRRHLSWNLIKKIIIFPKKKMLGRLEQYRNAKKIFVVKNRKEVQELLLSIL